MKSFFFVMALLSIPADAHARAEAKFLGFMGVVTVTDRIAGQRTDEDPQQIYALMNVPPKQENGQEGKLIQLDGKKLTILCADRKEAGIVCTVFVKAGPQGTIDSRYGRIRFVALGEEAAAVHALFHADPQTGRADFSSADGSLRINSDGGTFLVEYTRP